MWEKLNIQDLTGAIDQYLRLAYPGDPPLAVQSRLQALRAAPPDQLYDCQVLERPPGEQPARFALRLGNRFYPHMKLVIEQSPAGAGSLLRCDTHDRHIQPPESSPEHAAFCELTRKNQALAEEIEAAWEREGLPTFKRFLRDDLARRRALRPSPPSAET